MSPLTVVVVLTDGEANLAHYMDLLRRRGVRVLATTRPYEAALFVARNPGACLVARETLLPEPADDFLRQVRELAGRPFVVLATPAGPDAKPLLPKVDLVLAEPFRFSALLEALEYGAERALVTGGEARVLPQHPPPPGDVAAADFGEAAKNLFRVFRRFSELERDQNELLAAGAEALLEATAASRAALLVPVEGQDVLAVVRRFGESGADSGPREVGRDDPGLGEAIRAEIPTLRHDLPGRASAFGGGDAPLVVPIVEKGLLLALVRLADRRGGEPFGPADVAVATVIAGQLATTVSNARKWEDLHRMAVVDPLTGLFNRRFFDRQIAVELERARRYDRQVTLALMDIDNFKIINDLNGYATGDVVIRSVAEIIRRSFREVDIVTRWGGDEFAILLPETGKPRVPRPGDPPTLNYVERVRRAVEEGEFKRMIPKLAGRITVSAGVATYPLDAKDRDSLFLVANQALHRAKRSGHNRVCVAGEETGNGPPVIQSALP